jgi:hypothetical protein
MSSRRYPSSSEKRKREKGADEFIETQRGAMDKFFLVIQELQGIKMRWL